jgi:peptide/nickel transport system substrate-binding protein
VSRRAAVLFLVLVAIAAPVRDLHGGEKGAALAPTTLVLGTRAEPRSLNPIAITSSEAQQVVFLIFQKLLQEQDDFMSFKPGLAESYSWSDDHLDLTFVLRKDASWSDGVPVTADDIRFTWSVHTDTTVAWPNASIKARIRDVVVKDARTVMFRFQERYLYQLMDANDGVILPKHLLGAIPRAKLKAAPFGRAPVGNGAYMLKRWEAGQYIDLVLNPRYRGETPRIERVMIKLVPDVVTLVAQLQAGEIDMLEGLNSSDLAGLNEKRGDVAILDVPSRRMNFVAWNNTRPFFASREVRRALSMAIDRRALIKSVWGGYARECTSPVVPILWAFDPTIPPIPFDPAAARKALASQGFKDTDGDGVVEREGKPFELELLVNDVPQRVDAVTMIQAQLKAAGVKVNLRVMEYNAYINRILAADYDAALVEWKVATRVDLTNLFHSSAVRPKGYNFFGYSNPEVDRILDEAGAQWETDAARALWVRAQRLIYEDQPCTFIAIPQELTAIDDRFCNVTPSPISIFAHITDWRIKPDCDEAAR